MADGFEQRLLETPDHLGRIINVEKNRTDRVDPHGPHSMRQYQPPLMGLKRRATVTDLNELPRLYGLLDQMRLLPEVEVVRKHDVVILSILTRKHRILPIDLPREERHPLVLNRIPIERADLEVLKVPCFDQLGHEDRKSTRLNSSHVAISYAVFCL